MIEEGLIIAPRWELGTSVCLRFKAFNTHFRYFSEVMHEMPTLFSHTQG